MSEPAEEFMLRVSELSDGCWQWLSTIESNGYGRWGLNGQKHLAHRWSYEHFVGPIPQGRQIDHLCRNQSCVNPRHLETVSQAENLRRGRGWAGQNAQKTHCKRGHEFTPENTYYQPSRPTSRNCRQCFRMRQNQRRQSVER